MPLYYARILQKTIVEYAILSESVVVPKELMNVLEQPMNSLADFNTEFIGHEIEELKEITEDEYIRMFDYQYPQFMNIDMAQKLMNITYMPEVFTEVERESDRDQL